MAAINTADPLLQVDNLRVHYGAGRQRLNAVDGLSLTVGAGQTVAIVGESGSGKSSAAMALVNGLAANGEWEADGIVFQGEEISRQELLRLRGRAITYMMQDPSGALNPVLTVGEQIKRVLKYHTQLSKAEREEQAIELMERVEIPDAASRLDAFPHEFSGGMQQRIVLAMALAPSPVLLIADEPTTGLDVTVEAQIFTLLDRLKRELNMSVVLVAHDLGVVATSADEAVVLYAGRVVETGSVAALFHEPRHPYTMGLLRCAHDLHDENVLNPIPGRIPGLGERPQGCVFHPRCAWKTAECEAAVPDLIQLDGQSVACIHHENLTD